tara:strand:+ start:180 stop:353 length:174 start_codon:yes stop_codon:yes gene_type:complete
MTYNFSMYMEEDENGEPKIIMEVKGFKDSDEAEEIANELFFIITDEEPEKEILKPIH